MNRYALHTILFLTVILLAAVFVLLGVVIPRQVTRDFGAAHTDLDFSRRVIYTLRLELQRAELLSPVNLNAGDQLFTVAFGRSAAEVSADLNAAGLLRSEQAFRDYLVYRGLDRQIQAGIYLLNPRENALEIAEHLVDEDPANVAFSFLAGWRAEEIAALLPSSGLQINSEDFIQFAQQPPSGEFAERLSTAKSWDGLLFPGEYQVMRDVSAQEILTIFSTRLLAELPADYQSRLAQHGLDLYQGIILASIIHKEMIVPEEATLIASVFLNRLKEGMPLQSDPTVQYALGLDEASGNWWKNPLTKADLRVVSPYNTYLYNGLPPSPICNAGMPVILAIVEAQPTSYYYFRATCDSSGRHVFSQTYEQHLAAACPK